jgi:antitoxin ParD1/3/4
VRELIGAEEKRKVEERLESLLQEGLQEQAAELTQADWKDIRQEALRQVKARKNLR